MPRRTGTMLHGSLHVRWADETEASSTVSSDSEHGGDITTQRRFSSSAAKYVNIVARTTYSFGQNECMPPRPVPRLRSHPSIREALPTSPGHVSLAGTHGQDDEAPEMLRSCPPNSAETTTADHDGGDGGVYFSERSPETNAITAPMHASSATLSPEKSTTLNSGNGRRCTNKRCCSPTATAFYQSERHIVETHLDSRDRSKHSSLFSSAISSRAFASCSAVPNTTWDDIFMAKKKRESQFSPVTVSAQSPLSPSVCYTSSGGSSDSPETFAVFRQKKGRSWESSMPSHRHASTATQQPRARCGCCGVTVQVMV